MRFFTSVHLLLLSYIIAALVFWEIALQKQSGIIYAKEVAILKNQVDSTAKPVVYNQRLAELKRELSLHRSQYIGEGTTFFLVILIGAAVVYTSFTRRIIMSRQQGNFMLSVTHELKSPIAAMKLNLQTLEKHQLPEDKRKQLLERCIRESNRLNELCNKILVASQIEGRIYKPTRETFDLSELVEDALHDYAIRYPRPFNEDIEAGCKIVGDRMMLHIAVNNLLENAIKYTPSDKPIAVKLQSKQGDAILDVIDQGAGIPDSEKRKIFNRFYRVGNEESRKSKGTGLGLYLTDKIIRQHKGRIVVKDNQPNGSIFEICLPCR